MNEIGHWKVGEVKLTYDFAKIFNLKISDYDVVNIHGHTPTFSDVSLLTAKIKSKGKPITYTLHCLANFYMKHVSKFYNWTMDRLIRLADSAVVTSNSYVEYAKYAKKIDVIPWGVDFNFFHQPRIENDEYNVLFVGQMRPYKGISLLLKAVKDLEVKLHVVGSGVDQEVYLENVKKQSMSNVHFYGNVKDVELREIYRRCDVLVLPSVSMNEAFGLVTLEAAAAGCVVVASNLPGVRDIVRQFGILVPPSNVDALRKAIIYLSEKKNRIPYHQKGYEHAKNYSWEKTGEQYEKVYAENLETKNKRLLDKGRFLNSKL